MRRTGNLLKPCIFAAKASKCLQYAVVSQFTVARKHQQMKITYLIASQNVAAW